MNLVVLVMLACLRRRRMCGLSWSGRCGFVTVDDHLHRLRQRGARDRLAERDRYRLVVEAARHGASQRQIACSLGTLSQATIARMLQNVTANPDFLRRAPIELVDRCVAGEISSDEMMRHLHELLDITGGVATEEEPAGATASADWVELERAFCQGLLSDSQFQTLRGNPE